MNNSVQPTSSELGMNKHLPELDLFTVSGELAEKRAQNVQNYEHRQGMNRYAEYSEIPPNSENEEYSFSNKLSIWFAKGFCCGLFCSKRKYVTVMEYERMVILRYGRLHKPGTFGPGLIEVLDGIDKYEKVDCRDIIEKLELQILHTKEKFPLAISTVICYNYYSPIKSVLDAQNAEKMLKDLCISLIRDSVANHTILEFIALKKRLQDYIRDELKRSTERWGVRVNRIEFLAVRKATLAEITEHKIDKVFII